LLEQDEQIGPIQVVEPVPGQDRGGTLLEQVEEQDDDDPL
jgi:hypothetical protein